jgi:biotin carboxyl carrier protein
MSGVVLLLVVVVVGLAAAVPREQWSAWLGGETPAESEETHPAPAQDAKVLRLSPQARQNLELVSKPVVLQEYWRKIQTPGLIVDRPGVTDRGVTAPVEGVVAAVHAFAGDTVSAGEPLFTLRLYSEYLQTTQSELFKAVRETQLIREQRTRLGGLAESGTIAGSRIIELDQQIRRQEGLMQAYRQGLTTRGLSAEQIAQVEAGEFVSTIEVTAPAASNAPEAFPVQQAAFLAGQPEHGLIYEIQELLVDLGEQVQAGQLLTILSNHRSLFIEGHAFKQEAPLLEQAAQHGWPIEVEFAEDDAEHWTALEQAFEVHHLSNTIDPTSRTFDFYVSLENQSRSYDKDGQTYVVWRFRPGQRVRLHVPVEQLEDVIVLPAAAVVREGPEAYVFQQNGDLFNRLPVRVLHEDRLNIVIAHDGAVPLGAYLAQGSAASLNRVLKAQAASGQAVNVHVHPDGTTHEAH